MHYGLHAAAYLCGKVVAVNCSFGVMRPETGIGHPTVFACSVAPHLIRRYGPVRGRCVCWAESIMPLRYLTDRLSRSHRLLERGVHYGAMEFGNCRSRYIGSRAGAQL